MAAAAGIDMMPCFLKEIDGRNHFVTERFDRKNGENNLSQTLAAIMPGADDYMKLCWIAETLKLPLEDILVGFASVKVSIIGIFDNKITSISREILYFRTNGFCKSVDY